MQKKPSEPNEKQEPQNPQEFVDALKKRGFKVNVMSRGQLEARRSAELELEGWHGKHPKK